MASFGEIAAKAEENPEVLAATPAPAATEGDAPTEVRELKWRRRSRKGLGLVVLGDLGCLGDSRWNVSGSNWAAIL
jgi:hypothetical protein